MGGGDQELTHTHLARSLFAEQGSDLERGQPTDPTLSVGDTGQAW